MPHGSFVVIFERKTATRHILTLAPMQIKMVLQSRHLFLIILLLSALHSIGQKINHDNDTIVLARDTTIRNQLIALDLSTLKGKTVETLLQNEIIGKYKEYWWTDEPPGKLQSLNLTYARGLYLKIFPVQKDGQAAQFSASGTFDFESFKKLKISELTIDKDFFEKRVKEMKFGKHKD
jgi:hypothetical protein